MSITTAPAWVVFMKRGLTDNGDYFLSICPSHKDDKKSLGLKIAEDGKILVKCYAGCSLTSICEALNIEMKDLFPPERYMPNEQSKVVAEYNYTDESGNLLYQVQRTDPKGFRQRRKTESGWEWRLGDVRRVLYRLPEIVSSNRPIVIVEGEKDVETLRKQGILATTCAGGADGWRPEYSQSLEGRYCIVIPDNDPPGEEFAVMVATWVPNALLVRLPGLPLKGDVTDWLATRTKADLFECVQHCARYNVAKAQAIYTALGGK